MKNKSHFSIGVSLCMCMNSYQGVDLSSLFFSFFFFILNWFIVDHNPSSG